MGIYQMSLLEKQFVDELIENNYDESKINLSVATRYAPTKLIDIS